MRASVSRVLGALAGLLLGAAAAQGTPPPAIPPEAHRSGFDQMAPETRAMQADDSANPGMLWVRDGADLFARAPSPGSLPCAGCHAESAMRGVAARYPAFDEATGRPVDLEGRIDLCRTRHQGATALPREGHDLLALTAYLANLSRGLPLSPPDDPRLAPARAEGRRLFATPMGQLGFSCAACHDRQWGRRLGAATIPQGHPTGYPLYRLEWQDLGSLERRLRNCLTGMRAEPFTPGSAEAVALALYLAERAAPLPVESPGVRP
ncbi:sulfur oxidation c-type cytochrome SoxA [Methylobacterium ajmalii]|jgi:sulfur-oxidizing protein SoxA|uniref:sulfur oxidation c-type cytochrome SoxA n=1 Tax=Methylobacterium ajmalii TaxID=2738439 RepID=UPI00190BAA0A|nr:sulfur oxidation c-type cytochrome SoxA [Methylobacterium ajmalii]MBK3401154.1 sulfur oxidation c-type cytochrome SoxA [Methylobacterium ajmalii]MBK3410999.1 sulfur oxidation c-type cytochrome SoxA [Methylobacterium ajmalii]MBK3426731.1 sulfur oxidation c-type cytochrome SoxA [Methylobacterium ajmalii]MBZ6412180.1 sulfur oxidation c-type cytochrome SoxA [Methylobacterium sp.]